MVPEIWRAKDIIFCHFGQFFALLLPWQPRKSKFKKKWKKPWRYYHFTHLYHKWKSYEVWSATNIIFCHFGLFFFPFYPLPLKTQKTKILIKWKNENHMRNGSWFLRYGAQQKEFFFILDFFFLLFYPLKTQKIRILKNEKNAWRYHHFTHMSQKLWSNDVRFLRYNEQRTDGKSDI